MYYLIGRDLDADGRYEFIQDMDNMILTEDPNRALQMTENELNYIDMEYLNQGGFYAMEADRFQVSLLEALLFRPPVRGYRPRVAPPPRRYRHRRVPPRNHLLGIFGIPVPPKPPRAPKPRPAARRKSAPAPRPAGHRAAAGRPAARPAPLHRKTVTPGRPGAARPTIGRPKIGGPSGAGRGGRGPGRR
ncbi:MAG: hypothetical protein IJ466_11110 [Clostridia bacterium]|nr:hypothetical protein [Clostridia bacterium]